MTLGSSSQREAIIAGALLGLASGILSWSGFSTLVTSRSPETLPKWARSRWTKRVAIPGAAVEVLANAFVSSLPPRTDPPPLIGRVVMGATSGALGSYGTSSVKTGAIAGAVSAPVGAWVSTNGRARLAKWVPDALIAFAETVVAFGLSAAGAGRSAGRR